MLIETALGYGSMKSITNWAQNTRLISKLRLLNEPFRKIRKFSLIFEMSMKLNTIFKSLSWIETFVHLYMRNDLNNELINNGTTLEM